MKSASVVRRRERIDLIRLTIFLLVAGLFTYWVGVVVAAYRPGDRVDYRAVFNDVSGLQTGDAVRIAGVDVGKVSTIRVQPNATVLVTFTVPRRDPLNASTEATVQYSNLTGDRIIELTRPDANARILPVGATIPASQTRPALDLDALLNGFKPLFQGLTPQDINSLSGALIKVLQGQSSELDTLLQRGASVTNTLGDRQLLVGEVIRNLNTVAGTFDRRRDAVGQLIDQLSGLVHGLQGQDSQVLDSAARINAFAEDAASLISAARGSLRPDLVNLARAARGVNAHVSTLVAILQKLPQHYAAIEDTASYGNFLNFFLCGVRVRTDAGLSPWLTSDVARCK